MKALRPWQLRSGVVLLLSAVIFFAGASFLQRRASQRLDAVWDIQRPEITLTDTLVRDALSPGKQLSPGVKEHLKAADFLLTNNSPEAVRRARREVDIAREDARLELRLADSVSSSLFLASLVVSYSGVFLLFCSFRRRPGVVQAAAQATASLAERIRESLSSVPAVICGGENRVIFATDLFCARARELVDIEPHDIVGQPLEVVGRVLSGGHALSERDLPGRSDGEASISIEFSVEGVAYRLKETKLHGFSIAHLVSDEDASRPDPVVAMHARLFQQEREIADLHSSIKVLSACQEELDNIKRHSTFEYLEVAGAFDKSPEAILICDGRLNVRIANEAWYSISGLSQDQTVKHNVLDVLRTAGIDTPTVDTKRVSVRCAIGKEDAHESRFVPVVVGDMLAQYMVFVSAKGSTPKHCTLLSEIVEQIYDSACAALFERGSIELLVERIDELNRAFDIIEELITGSLTADEAEEWLDGNGLEMQELLTDLKLHLRRLGELGALITSTRALAVS